MNEEFIKDLGVFFHGFRQAEAPFNITDNCFENHFKSAVFRLLRKDGQSLHNGEPGIDHCGKLSGKYDNILAGDFGLHERDIGKYVFWLGLELLNGQITPFKLKPGHFIISSIQFAFDCSPFFCFCNPRINWHFGQAS